LEYISSLDQLEAQPQTDVNLNVSLQTAMGVDFSDICIISDLNSALYDTIKYNVRSLRIQTSDFSMQMALHARATRIDIWMEFIKYVSCRGTSKRVSQKASIDHIVSITDNAHDKKMPRFTGPLRAHMDNMKEKLS